MAHGDSLLARLLRGLRAAGRRLPGGWPDLGRQLVLFAGAYWLYRLVRGFVDGQTAAAFENARLIIDAEKAMGLFFEPGLQDWAHGHGWILAGAGWAYVNTHFVVTTAFLIWLYLFRNHAYYFVRNMFMVAMGMALVGYVAFPTAPPRYMVEWGFSDTVASLVGESAERGAGVLYNPFAAVPSMHVGFALLIAVPAIRLVGSRALRALWALYPAVVTFVVVVTANHFWLDAALGALVAGLSAWVASAALARARPEAWGWRARGAEATA